jgi:hypothetical protein
MRVPVHYLGIALAIGIALGVLLSHMGAVSR